MKQAPFLLGALALMGSCASVQPISGGEQDKAPPVLVRASPADRSTGFNAKAILLEFNERIQLERVRDRLLISPPLAATPDVRLAGPRSVEIVLNAALEPNTTYSINLGESVKDLTEGNAAAGLTYVISTGTTLDSAVIHGQVLNAFSGAAEKDVIVGLYAPNDTAAFRSGRPSYMTRTDATGSFTLANLPHRPYSVLALRDKNANYKYDLPNEEVAFNDALVDLRADDTASTALSLRMFLPVSAQQLVRSYSVTADGALELVFARAADSIAVRDVAREGGVLRWTPEFVATRDTVLLWASDTTLLDQGRFEISADGTVLDTIRYRPTKRMPFHTGLVATLIQQADGSSIRIRSARPISAFDSTRISLHSDSLALPFTCEQVDARTLQLAFRSGPGVPVELLALPKAVRDIHGGANDTLRTAFGTAAERTTGSLEVNLSGLAPDAEHLLQVLDGQQRVQLEQRVNAAHPQARWQLLAPGMRTLRLVLDANRNGRWDTGEWATLTQPERTWYHVEPVNVRAAWDLKVDWALPSP